MAYGGERVSHGNTFHTGGQSGTTMAKPQAHKRHAEEGCGEHESLKSRAPENTAWRTEQDGTNNKGRTVEEKELSRHISDITGVEEET